MPLSALAILAVSLPLCACGPRSPSEWLVNRGPEEVRARYSISQLNAAKYDAASLVAHFIERRELVQALAADAATIRAVLASGSKSTR